MLNRALHLFGVIMMDLSIVDFSSYINEFKCFKLQIVIYTITTSFFVNDLIIGELNNFRHIHSKTGCLFKLLIK